MAIENEWAVTVLLPVALTVVGMVTGAIISAIFYNRGVEKGQKQAKELADKLIIQSKIDLVDAINALRRLDGTAKNGILGISEEGKIRAEFQRSMTENVTGSDSVSAVVKKAGEDPKTES